MIRYAIDEEGKRVFVDNAYSKEKLFCPICNKTVFPRKGVIRIHHYAHTRGHSCNDSWKYEDKTQWHIDWQAMFTEESRECTVSDSKNHRHLADVFWENSNTVIEFQHGPITNKCFDKRNKYFTSLGNKVIWVFDLIKNSNQDELSYRDEGIAEWQNPLESFKTFKFKENDVDIFFQIKNEDKEASDGFCLLKVEGVDSNGFELFQYSKYSKQEFLNYAIKGSDKEAKKILKPYSFSDTLYLCMNRKSQYVFYGCPLKENGTIREKLCLKCKWHRKRPNDCSDLQDACVEKLKNIDFFKYYYTQMSEAIEGRITKIYCAEEEDTKPSDTTVFKFEDSLPLLGHSIPYLWQQNPEAGIMIFSIVDSPSLLEYGNRQVKMNRKQYNEGLSEDKWFGSIKSIAYNSYTTSPMEVFYSTEDIWYVKWWKPLTIINKLNLHRVAKCY